jgi:hypothetical protein
MEGFPNIPDSFSGRHTVNVVPEAGRNDRLNSDSSSVAADNPRSVLELELERPVEPAPAPLLALAGVFGWSRRLGRRLGHRRAPAPPQR